ncbi:MAG: 2'-5' RNA ligase family protein [Lachnospiraceae bacterium]|nr:2'-5' RNA ligase family protein [Lachnospiraceae bacterium]
MHLISLYFDEKSNQILQNHIDKIAEVTGNDFMTRFNVPPHLTLSSIEARSVEVLVPIFKSLEKKLEVGKIQFVSVGQLLPYVIYATPVLNKYLMELSETVYSAFSDIPETTVSKYYKPYSWLPHVTLGKTLDKDQMQKAFLCMQERFTPFEAEVTEIGLAKVNPHEDVEIFPLK